MWIRTTRGDYVNSDYVTEFGVSSSKLGGFNIAAQMPTGVKFLALFDVETDAQNYLDRMMKTLCTASNQNSCWRIDMGEWNYRGHEKDHKEKRRGGS